MGTDASFFAIIFEDGGILENVLSMGNLVPQ